MATRTNTITRFLLKVDKTRILMEHMNTPCWEWKGTKTREYGQFWLDGKVIYAHIFSYQFYCGPILHGMKVDHLCLNKSCVNPDHLELVTPQENVIRAVETGLHYNAAKTHCPKGHPYNTENTYIWHNGWRHCRVCDRERKREK